jgi:hypothetical protein
MNFGKRFPKIIRAKLEFQGVGRNIGGRRENFIIYIVFWSYLESMNKMNVLFIF